MTTRIDVIILSNTSSDELRLMTEECLKSLFESETGEAIDFHAIVVESNRDFAGYSGDRITTIYPLKPFGYNAYMNIGIKASRTAFVCLCNNDLIFHRMWASHILEPFEQDVELMSACPYCNYAHPKLGIGKSTKLISGLGKGSVTGWCIFARRRLFDQIGLLDEKLIFWYCDYDLWNTLKLNGIKHALVTASEVDHLGSRTLDTHVSGTWKEQLTHDQYLYFDYKWHHHSKLIYFVKRCLRYVRSFAGRRKP